VSKVDSIHCRMTPSDPNRLGSSLRSAEQRPAEGLGVPLELGAREAFGVEQPQPITESR
jgi:hypothetical protein